MFENLQPAPADAILGLTEAFKADPNPQKINLAVGVYKDAHGETPVLHSVKQAEKRLLERETTKTYLGIAGIANYGAQIRRLLCGEHHEILANERAVTLQTPGGTGALRLAADFIKKSWPSARVWCSEPTWPNHPHVFHSAGLPVEYYSYFDADGMCLDFDDMLESLQQIPPGDIVCLHGCCHNPSGVDPTRVQWNRIADVVYERGLLPLVDFAYQGFGDGVEVDAAGLRAMARPGCELLVTTSCSKNFSLYCERVGALTAVAPSLDSADVVLSQLKRSARASYSNPPSHGAAVVAEILGDAELRELWERELAEMRMRINGMRRLFADTMKQKSDRDFSFITSQRGMFSFSGLSSEQADRLRTEFSIYMVRSGRINVGGISESNVERLCDSIAAVL